MLQAGLEGEPTWKTPRVPPAQSPGITPLTQEADSQLSITKAAPAFPDALQLDAFVNVYVESIVSEAKSELLAEALHATPQKSSTQAGAPEAQASLAFTQGSSAGSTANPHKSRSAPARAGPHKAQPSPVQVPLAQHAVTAGRQQQQLGPDVPVSSSTQAGSGLEATASTVCSRGSSELEVQHEGRVGDAVSSSLQAPAESEDGEPSKGNNAGRTGSNDDQAGRQVIDAGVASEMASAGKQASKDELGLSEGADEDAEATRMVSEIVQEILHAVSEHPHAEQVRIYSSSAPIPTGYKPLTVYPCQIYVLSTLPKPQ